MNESEIDNMFAGFELSSLIAERVMGIPRHTYEVAAAVSDVPAYSTDIEAAWQVVEKLHLSIGPSLDNGEGWYCALMGSKIHGATAETAPLAICRAALKVKIA